MKLRVSQSPINRVCNEIRLRGRVSGRIDVSIPYKSGL